MKITIPIAPPSTTAQRQTRIAVSKQGKAFAYKSKEGQQNINDLLTFLCPAAPEKPIDGPVRLYLTFFYPLIGKDTANREKRLYAESGGNIPQTSKPDWDNASKHVVDCLVKAGWIKDDSLIYEAHVLQYRNIKPRIEIEVIK